MSASSRPAVFHPLVAEWFRRRFAGPTDPQAQAWPALSAGRGVLVSAPTGSGKTLAAFLVCIDRLVRAALDGTLDDRIEVVYVSPLKALSNDVQKNLDQPLAEIAALAAEQGLLLPPIRTAVRTGDTPASERQRMMRRPPHILVTTPESLFILVTAERSRLALATTRTVVVDEIHAVVGNKRGSHLALSLARLDDLVEKAGGRAPQRIGLSATVTPIDEVARFLSPGAIDVIDTGHRRAMDLAVEVPRDELGAVASNEMWAEIYDRVADLIRAHKTTLVFVNTRRLAERVAHHLGERLGDQAVLAHHGSLSRRLRLSAEDRLRRGDLHAIVATASLELGIDIGSVDLVCQIGSPRSIAIALQRIGRSGHHADRASIPKGRIFATTRDELVESAALVGAIRSGALDRLEIPAWPRDVLAQHIVAAAAGEPWREEDLFNLVRRAYQYRDLPRAEFDAVIAVLSDGISTRRSRATGAFLHRDRVNGVVRGRRGARLAAITSGGAIPDNASYPVVAEPEGAIVGTVDEDFAVESLAGDIFLLGTNSWRIRRVEAGRVRVEDAHGAPPSIPFWRGEAPGRTVELSAEVARVREEIARAEQPELAHAFLVRECGLDRAGAEQATEYVRAGAAALGAVPTGKTVVAERFFDEGGGMQLVLHAPFGARSNRAWGLALRKRFCRSFNFELQAAATDNGIVISLGEQHSFPLDAVFRFLGVETVEDVLTQAMLPAPVFTARWRWNAARALAILRFAAGRKVPAPILRMRSDDLLAAVFPDQAACPENLEGDIRIPNHPLVNETIRDCLHEAMDLDGLKDVLVRMRSGDIRTVAIDTPEPSIFSHEILNANPYAYLDDAPLEERRARAVQMRRTLAPESGEIGALDPDAIAAVAAEAWPVVRDMEELHDALLTLGAYPADRGPGIGRQQAGEWTRFFEDLVRQRRATTLDVRGGRVLWVAAECRASAGTAYAGGEGAEAAVTGILRGWLESTGPATAGQLADHLALDRDRVEAALLRLESEGQILRGRFTTAGAAPDAELQWCNRRLLARIHRLTIGRLRREIEPVTGADFVRFLFRWQHVAPGTQLHGIEGTLQVLEQLQGYEVLSAAWERDVLRSRIAQYAPDLLDRLCLSGEMVWGRLSAHPAFDEAAGGNPEWRTTAGRRLRPTRAAPIAIFRRDDAAWLADPDRATLITRLKSAGPGNGDAGASSIPRLSHAARDVLVALERRGASFLTDLVAASGRLASEVEDALWELAAAGLVTADGFDNLRALVDPTRRNGQHRERFRRARHVAGRWALLMPPGVGTRVAGDTSVIHIRDPRNESRPPADRAEAFARQLLLRWGVVFRDLLARETLAPPWRQLLLALRRMEARGEIRGGRFVAGFVGEQFARPEAIDALRAARHMSLPHRALLIAAADPLNLAGILIPGPRVSPLSAQVVEVLGVPDADAASGRSSPVSSGNSRPELLVPSTA